MLLANIRVRSPAFSLIVLEDQKFLVSVQKFVLSAREDFRTCLMTFLRLHMKKMIKNIYLYCRYRKERMAAKGVELYIVHKIIHIVKRFKDIQRRVFLKNS